MAMTNTAPPIEAGAARSDCSIGYRAELDGLRAFAVLAVIIYHFNQALLPRGYLGVDVFFVLSGYLISSILLSDIKAQRFSVLRFWDRRIKRILPAAALVVLVISSVQYSCFFEPDALQYQRQKTAALGSYANIYFWLNHHDYWGPALEQSPWLHYWSLSLEEHYYVLYPVCLCLVLRLGKRWLTAALTLVTLVSFALYAYGSIYYPNATFYLLPTRVWELGSGCLLAMPPSTAVQSKASLRTILGLGVIGAAYLVPVGSGPATLHTLAAVVGACCC